MAKLPVWKSGGPLWKDNGSGLLMPAWAVDEAAACACCGGGGGSEVDCSYCAGGSAPRCYLATVSGLGEGYATDLSCYDFSPLNASYLLISGACADFTSGCCCWNFLTLIPLSGVECVEGEGASSGATIYRVSFSVCSNRYSFGLYGYTNSGSVVTVNNLIWADAPHDCSLFEFPITSGPWSPPPTYPSMGNTTGLVTLTPVDCATATCSTRVIITLTPDGPDPPDCETYTWDYTTPDGCDCDVTLLPSPEDLLCFHIECADESTNERCIPIPTCPPTCDEWDACDSEDMVGAFALTQLQDVTDSTGGTDPGTGGTWTAKHWTYENLNDIFWDMVGTEPRNPGTTCEGSGTISAGAYTVWANLGTQGDYSDPGILIRYMDFTYGGGLHSEHYVYAICVAVECNEGRTSIVRFLLAIQNFTGSDDEAYGPWPPTSATIDDNCYEIGDLDEVLVDSPIHGGCMTEYMATKFNFDNFLSGGVGGANTLIIHGIMGPTP